MEMKIFKIKKSFKKGGIHVNPSIYWGISLSIAFAIILASVILGFFMFKKISGGLMPAESTEQIHTISKERIDKVLEYFKERELKSAEILSSPSPVIDPSR
jgi:hypothetical protein